MDMTEQLNNNASLMKKQENPHKDKEGILFISFYVL